MCFNFRATPDNLDVTRGRENSLAKWKDQEEIFERPTVFRAPSLAPTYGNKLMMESEFRAGLGSSLAEG